MLTDENVEKENETLPPSLCFFPSKCSKNISLQRGFSFYFCNGFHDNLCYNPQDQKMLEQDLVLFISGA